MEIVFTCNGLAFAKAALDEGECTLGRHSSCQVHVPDPSVSDKHARVYKGDQGVLIEDLGSTNGTKVNGKLISAPTRLAEGDRISLGETKLAIAINADARGQTEAAGSKKPGLRIPKGVTTARTNGQKREEASSSRTTRLNRPADESPRKRILVVDEGRSGKPAAGSSGMPGWVYAAAAGTVIALIVLICALVASARSGRQVATNTVAAPSSSTRKRQPTREQPERYADLGGMTMQEWCKKNENQNPDLQARRDRVQQHEKYPPKPR